MVLENINPTLLGTQMGGSALIGGVIGFAAKKVAKIIAIIIGLQLVVFKFLESRGVLQVNWGRLVNASQQTAGAGAGAGQTLIETFLSTASVGGSFALGFFVGFKRA